MKSVIIYYSFSGNTKKVAQGLSECLKEKGEVVTIELKDLNEDGKFLSQCKKAFRHEKAAIQETNYDLSAYDLICVGTPVWAFSPTPAINTYLDKVSGVAGKSAVIFTTHGSGTGVNRCQNYMQELLSKQGVKEFKKFSIPQFRVKENEFVLAKIKEVTRLWPNG